LAMTAKWCRFSWSSTADNQTLDQTADRIQRCRRVLGPPLISSVVLASITDLVT
jgi:hypothetical protein